MPKLPPEGGNWVSSIEIHLGIHDPRQSDLYVAAMDDSVTGGTYEILVGATLEEDWAAWFDGFEVRADGPVTVVRGEVVDQAGLHGLLARFRDLGIPLLDVHRVELKEGKDV